MQGIGFSGDGVPEKTTQGYCLIWTLATVRSPCLPSIRETKRTRGYPWNPGTGDKPGGDQSHIGTAAAAGHTAWGGRGTTTLASPYFEGVSPSAFDWPDPAGRVARVPEKCSLQGRAPENTGKRRRRLRKAKGPTPSLGKGAF